MKRLPPVGTVVPLALSFVPLRATDDDVFRLEDRMARTFGGDSAFAFDSGRAALATILSTLAKTRSGGGVLVPAYTCYTVASAVAHAGLRIYPVDMIPETLDFNYRHRLAPPPKDVIAAISPGLFGIPTDLQVLRDICRQHRIFLIEDAAQTLGAEIRDHPAGHFGDASIFSFGRGKPLGGVGGGILVTRGRALTQAMKQSTLTASKIGPLRTGIKSAAGALALNPLIFSIIRLLPFIRMGTSIFKPEFPVESMDPAVARLIHAMLKFLEPVIQGRMKIAAELRARVDGAGGLLLPKPPEGLTGAYLRFPVIFDDPADRDAVLYRLTTRGLGASTMYPKPIHQIEKAREFVRDDLRPYPGVERIARGILTLPTHARVARRDMDEMAKIIRDVTRAGVS